jgi:hypothetical protein
MGRCYLAPYTLELLVGYTQLIDSLTINPPQYTAGDFFMQIYDARNSCNR